MKLKMAMAVNRSLKKQRSEMRKYVRQVKKDEYDWNERMNYRSGEKTVKTESGIQEEIFLHGLPNPLPNGLEEEHRETQETSNGIAIPMIHSMEPAPNSMEYQMLQEEPMESISL